MKAALAVGMFVGVAVVFSFFVPVIPANFSHSWESVCPVGTPPTQLCGSDGSILFHGYGSVTYSFIGIGGWWGSPIGYRMMF